MNQTITQVLRRAKDRPREWVAVRYKRNSHWFNYSWAELYENVELAAAGFSKMGLKAGDRIAILADTCHEWLIFDLAIMSLGAVTVPIYASQRGEEISTILNDSQARGLVVENASQWQKWLEVKGQCPSVSQTFIIHKNSEITEPFDLETLLEKGREVLKEDPELIANAIATHKLSDWATLIYTSGTGGAPKGVVLTHQQIAGEMESVARTFNVNEKDSSLVFLPFAHILGRVEYFVGIYSGFTLAFAESIDRLRNNLPEIQPTLLIAVPRIFEKLHVAIISQVQSNPTLKRLFDWAMSVGYEVSERRQKGQNIPALLLGKHLLADKLVFQSIRAKLGGRLRFSFSGGAPLAEEIQRFFHAIGILILEGYGLSETTAAVTANSPLAYKFGTVGQTLPGMKVKIAEDGEILLKGPMIMKEYYNNPSDTAQVLKDGYFYTGDIGELDTDGFLKITDRKKDLIKTSGGKYIAPQKLENLLKINPLISQVLIHGDQEKYVVALITLNQPELVKFARAQNLSFQDYSSLTQHPQVKAVIRGAVAEVNAQLASFETIKNFAILPADFTMEAGELTPSLKVRRKFCSEKYRAQIAALY